MNSSFGRILCFLMLSVGFLVMASTSQAVTVDLRIAAEIDDVEEAGGTAVDLGNVYSTSSDLELVYDGSYQGSQIIGLRFINIQIPKGAFINSAYLEFTSDANRTNNNSLTISGENSGNAAVFVSGNNSYDVSTRVTTSGVSWTPGNWSNGGKYPTSDLSSIVSTITNRSDWNEGNAMAFTIQGSGTVRAKAFSDGPSNSPRLVIDFSYNTTAPAITLDKSELNPATDFGLDAAAETFNITNTGDGADLNYTISADATWLTFSQNGSILSRGDSDSITVSYDTASLPGGIYYATITVADPEATPNSKIIAVTLAVGTPTILLDTSTIPVPISLPVDKIDSSYSFTLKDSGDADLIYSIISDVTWLTFTPASGTINPTASDVITLTINTAGFIENSGYAAIVTVSGVGASNNPQTFQLNLVTPVKEASGPALNSDDAEEYLSGSSIVVGSIRLNSSDLEMVTESGNQQIVGIRFPNVNISQNTIIEPTIIEHAYLRFTAHETHSGITDLTIAVQNGLDPGTFTTAPFNISGRTATESVDWNNIEPWASGNNYWTTNIKDLVQTQVDNDDWATSDKSMVFIISGSGKRNADSYNAGAPPVLEIYTLSSNPVAPIISLSENIFVREIDYQDGASLAGGNSFTVTATGTGDLNYSYSADQTWISLSSNGLPPGGSPLALANGFSHTITVVYNDTAINMLAPGVHYATISVTDSAAKPTEAKVYVALTIRERPFIELDPTTLNVSVPVDNNERTAFFAIKNTGDMDLIYTVDDDQTWMSVTPSSGTASQGEIDVITVTFDTNTLSYGDTYTGQITVSDPKAANDSQTVDVQLFIGQPSIEITAVLPDPIYIPADFANSDYFFTLKNTGNSDLNFEVSAAETWMTFNPRRSALAPDEETAITINLSSSGMTVNSNHSGTIIITDPTADNSPQSIPINITIVNQTGHNVGGSSDDAEEDESDGDMHLTSSDLEMVEDGSEKQQIGIRFDNIVIPAGSFITNAYIQFTSDGNVSDDTDLEIYGELTDNAQTFTIVDNNISNRPLTATKVDWTSLPNWSNGSLYNSPNIATILQELVIQPGWQSSNAMAFIIKGSQGTRRAHAYDDGHHPAPRLIIEWIPGTKPFIHVDPAGQLGVMAVEGSNAADRTFTLQNTGSTNLNYTITDDAGWLVCSHATGILVPGASQVITIIFNTAPLSPGVESGTITITDANAYNSPFEYLVNLQVNAIAAGNSCGDVPIYAQNIINPAILIQMDTSGSMRSNTSPDNSQPHPQTPNLKNILQQMVNQANWTPNESDVAFIFSGSGLRTAISYDGTSSEAPLLHVDYSSGGSDLNYETRISQSSDDAEETVSTGSVSFTSNDLEFMEDSSDLQKVGLRFQNINIPANASITNAYISFSQNVTASTPSNIQIKGQDTSAITKSEAPTFSNSSADISSRPLINSVVVSWSPDTWWANVSLPRYQVGRAVISDLVKDRSIAWGYGVWDSVLDGPQWNGTGSGPDLTQLHSPWDQSSYSTSSNDYIETPYSEEYTTGDVNQYDLFTDIMAPVQSRTAAETVVLQNTILATTTGSGTPLGPSMLAARAYFRGQKPDADGNYYDSSLTCQPKFLINITDGHGYMNHTRTDYMRSYAHWLADDDITAIAIGFDLSNSSQIDVVAEISNARGEESTTDQLYAIHEDRDNADGDNDDSTGVDAFSAASGAELKEALEKITDSVKKQLFYGSAPAPSTSVDMGSFIIVASFNAEGWFGDLKAIPYDPLTGQMVITDPLLLDPSTECTDASWTCWRAGYLMPSGDGWQGSYGLPSDRSFTIPGPISTPSGDGTGNAIPYIETTFPTDNYMCKDFGDIIKSTPKIIDKPKRFHYFDNYRKFKFTADVNTRNKLVAIGANDGALHFFNLNTGTESHRFYPMGVHGTLAEAGADPSYDICNEDEYCHRYMVDGSPIVEDIFIATNQVTSLDTGWRTIVITGLGNGGDSYFAIDSTYNNSFDAAINPSRYLWNYTDSELGLAISDASISKVNASSDSFGGWAVFFGSGYATSTSQSTKEAYVYGLKAWDKSMLWGADEKIKIETDDSLNFAFQAVSADFSIGDTITAVSGASGKIIAMVDLGSSGSLKLTNISGVFVDDEIIINGSTGAAKAAGTIHSSYLNDAMATPIAADLDLNDINDFLYAGTLHGRAHRIQNIGEGATPSSSCFFDFGEQHLNYDSMTGDFTVGLTVTGGTTGATGTIIFIDVESAGTTGTLSLIDIGGIPFEHGEVITDSSSGSATIAGGLYKTDLPIRAAMDYAFAEDYDTIWIYFGTGRFESQVDKTTTNQNYFVGMKDNLLSPVPVKFLSDLTGMEILSSSDPLLEDFRSITGSNSLKNDWYMKLTTASGEPSERVITQPLVAGGIVFFQTFQPDNDPCAGNGKSWLYALDYETGLPPEETVFDIDNDGNFNNSDKIDFVGDGNEEDKVIVTGIYLGRGTPTGLVLEKNILFAGTSDGVPVGTPVNLPRLKAQLKSWKDSSL